MALDDVYTEVLGEHSRNPDHKHKLYFQKFLQQA